MARGPGDYVRDFWQNLFADTTNRRWWKSVMTAPQEPGRVPHGQPRF